MGETANSVAARLEENGLIRKGSAFRTYLVYSGMDTSVQAGEYTLSPAMSAVEIARELQDATPEEVDFNILAGWRAEEIAAALPTSGLSIQPGQISAHRAQSPRARSAAGWGGGRDLEGFLLPDSYRFTAHGIGGELVATFTLAFDQALTDDLRAGFDAQGLDL